jgi:quercetin dioxygenase-like cupin family protein
VARSGEQIDNPVVGLSLRFVQTAADTGGELLEMEATYEPSSAEAVAHFHPSQREHFEVLEGTMQVRIGDAPARELRAGDRLEIDAGTVHAMWNDGPDRARTRWETRPALRTEEFFEQTAQVFRDAEEQGREPDGSRLAAIVETYSDEFRISAQS